MPALSRRQPLEDGHTAVVVSCAAFHRARSHRALDSAPEDPRAEIHPWAYCFPRPNPVGTRGD